MRRSSPKEVPSRSPFRAKHRRRAPSVSIFRVSDTGIGMTPEQLDKLFRRFQQADSSTTRRFGGTGLGLSLTKAFADLLGGEVEVASEHGRGSSFTVRLPSIYAAPLEDQSPARSTPGAAAASRVAARSRPRHRRRCRSAGPDDPLPAPRGLQRPDRHGRQGGPGPRSRTQAARHPPRRDDARHRRLVGAELRSRPTRTWPTSRSSW